MWFLVTEGCGRAVGSILVFGTCIITRPRSSISQHCRRRHLYHGWHTCVLGSISALSLRRAALKAYGRRRSAASSCSVLHLYSRLLLGTYGAAGPVVKNTLNPQSRIQAP